MLTLLAAVFALAAPVPKATAPELKWKFTKGDTVYVTATTESTSAIPAGGGGIAAQNNTSTNVVIYKLVAASADDKGATFELTFLLVKEGHAGGGAAPKLSDVPKAAGKVVTLTLDKDHKVTKMAGADEAKGGGSQLLQEDYLRHKMEDLLRAVPGKALAKGDTWTGEHEHLLSGDVTAKRSDRGTVGGTEDGLTKLEVETDNALVSVGKGGPRFTLDLKGDKGKRTVLFDAKAGRVRKLTEDYTMAGTIDLGGPGQTLQVSTTTKVIVTVSDTEPKEGK